MLSVKNELFFVLFVSCLVSGCGKKMIDSKAKPENHNLPQKLERNLTLVVNEDVSLTTTYKLPESAVFKLPTILKARFGNAIGKKIKIFYNYSGPGQYDFHCTYSSTLKDKFLALENCESSDGDEVIANSDDTSEVWFPVDKGSKVKLELINPSGTKMNIESDYLVEWK